MDDLAVEFLSAKTPLLEESSVAATATGNFTSQDVSHAVITAAMKVHSVLGTRAIGEHVRRLPAI